MVQAELNGMLNRYILKGTNGSNEFITGFCTFNATTK